MVEAEQLMEAQALYRRVLARYSSRDLAYYIDHAKEALADLQISTPAVVAFRPDRALPR
jgi:alpha-D-ribose 1-methylphosphonate 5-triphosphate synthase subunit PhnH